MSAIMTVLRAVVERYGLPMALYTDRAHRAVHMPAGSAPRTRDGSRRSAGPWPGSASSTFWVLASRARSERINQTLQDRLVNELRVAGIRTVAAANRYLRTSCLSAFNAEFGRPPADPTAAFVPLGRVDLGPNPLP